ncbi:putative RNA polymerase sigma factor [Oscillibacter valericigenes Sjm18-20]|nr:putative RNA polymerase sigma factor [Oscillibacter valericigenes Sjm18-20]
MISEIEEKCLSFRDKIILCHTIIAIWNSCQLDKNNYTKKMIESASQFAKKYSKQEYEGQILDYVDNLIKDECGNILAKKSSRSQQLNLNFKFTIDERNKLVEKNLKLARDIAKKYEFSCGGKEKIEDLISVSYLGLVRGVDNYKLDNGDFLQSIKACIESEILQYLHSEAILSQMGTPIIKINAASEFDCTDYLVEKENIQEIRLLLDQLSSKEREIINFRFGLNGEQPKTIEDISSILNISKSYVSILERRIIDKIRGLASKYADSV